MSIPLSFGALAALVAVPLAAPLPHQTVHMVGTLTDSTTGNPIAAGRVIAIGHPAVAITDGSGGFDLVLEAEGLVGSRVTIRAMALGYATATREVIVTGSTVRVDIALAPAALELSEIVLAGEAQAGRRQALYSSVAARGSGLRRDRRHHPDYNREGYAHIEENAFLAVDVNPLSTFSIDVDRASYSNIRRFIHRGERPPIDAVRVEEMVNYFRYRYPSPRGEHPFSVTTDVMEAPWNTLHRLVRIALQTTQVDTEDLPPSNLVFLLDVSGSMRSPDKLPLLKQSFGLLVNQLRATDRVAIVVYAGAAGLVLPSTPGTDKQKILSALGALEAGGSTAGGAGIKLAYDVARKHHIEGGNNRVILATDGDFNVGASSDAAMIRLIEEKRRQGTFLTVLGFGTGNLQDAKMEQIADHGNGNFAYIDNIMEARKVLITEMGGTLLTVAKDVKIQVEFNPARVQAYRLIGYENRLLEDEDFNDDTKDAGELGAGHAVTALYEIIPVGVRSPVEVRGVDSLRYQTPGARGDAAESDELMFVRLRYKAPHGDESHLLRHAVLDRGTRPSSDFLFASAVAGFGMLLRESEYCQDLTLDQVLALARESIGDDDNGYRAEFVRLVGATRDLRLLEK